MCLWHLYEFLLCCCYEIQYKQVHPVDLGLKQQFHTGTKSVTFWMGVALDLQNKEKQIYGQTNRQVDRLTDRQTDRQTDRIDR